MMRDLKLVVYIDSDTSYNFDRYAVLIIELENVPAQLDLVMIIPEKIGWNRTCSF